jgi:hypothetical protein
MRPAADLIFSSRVKVASVTSAEVAFAVYRLTWHVALYVRGRATLFSFPVR